MTPVQFNTVSLGIACPMANERENAERFVEEVLAVCRRFSFRSLRMFAVLDKKCTDGTRELLEAASKRIPELTVVFAPENRCVVDAYVRGYREALSVGSDWILEIDAGFSHQPGDIPGLLTRMAQGYDCVFGSRFCKGGSLTGVPLKRYLLSKGGGVLANAVLGTRLHDMTSGFELFSRQALSAVLERGIVSRGPFFQTEIKAYVGRMKIVEVPIQYKGASHVITNKALGDSLGGLRRLFRMRLAGTLFLNNGGVPA